MGFSFDRAHNKSQLIMKVLLVVALAVAAVVAEPEAEAEASADAWYGYYGYPGYYGYGHGYYGYRHGYYGYPYYGYAHHLGKREADPALVRAALPDDKVGIHGLVTSVASNPVVGNPNYALAKSYAPTAVHPVHLPVHPLWKREAEANPEAEAAPDAWYGYYGYPGYYGYGHRYYGYRHGYYGYPYYG